MSVPWGGSILDSVIGVFLTQNVSDTSSSRAFMNVASSFPSKNLPRYGTTWYERKAYYHQQSISHSFSG